MTALILPGFACGMNQLSRAGHRVGNDDRRSNIFDQRRHRLGGEIQRLVAIRHAGDLRGEELIEGVFARHAAARAARPLRVEPRLRPLQRHGELRRCEHRFYCRWQRIGPCGP